MKQSLLSDFLNGQGIEAIISADDCGGLRPHLSLGMWNVRLLVSKEFAAKAKEILKILEE